MMYFLLQNHKDYQEGERKLIVEDTYRKNWNRQNRGLLIFLLDQSGSMQ